MEQGLAESIADGMTLSDQIASVNHFISNLMLTARFCEYHKGMGDIDLVARRVFRRRRGPKRVGRHASQFTGIALIGTP